MARQWGTSARGIANRWGGRHADGGRDEHELPSRRIVGRNGKQTDHRDDVERGESEKRFALPVLVGQPTNHDVADAIGNRERRRTVRGDRNRTRFCDHESKDADNNHRDREPTEERNYQVRVANQPGEVSVPTE